MSATWICSVCGCTTNHFSSSKGSLVCDACGTEVRSEAERQDELNYQKNMALAKSHLKVGDWEDAKRIVKPYEKSRPADKQVYLYLLVATTKCFEDYLLDNPAASKEAEIYWEKLQRLRAVNPAMREYLYRREAKLKEMNGKVSEKKMVLMLICIVLTIIAFWLMVSGEGISILFIILSIVGWVHSTKWINRNK